MGKNLDLDPGSGSGMKVPVHISESLETIFWVKKILKSYDADPDSGHGDIFDLDSRWKKFGFE
jgi:hypothetical protein